MWDCKTCGTTGIPEPLEDCPHCASIAGLQASGHVESLPEPAGTAAPAEAAGEGTETLVETTPSSQSSSQTAADTKKGW